MSLVQILIKRTNSFILAQQLLQCCPHLTLSLLQWTPYSTWGYAAVVELSFLLMSKNESRRWVSLGQIKKKKKTASIGSTIYWHPPSSLPCPSIGAKSQTNKVRRKEKLLLQCVNSIRKLCCLAQHFFSKEEGDYIMPCSQLALCGYREAALQTASV